jgi:hypothetical protein
MAEFGRTTIFGLAVGVGVGLGLAVLAPSVFPKAAQAARPYAKKAAKQALQGYLRAREGLAEFGEFAEDVVAEAKHEIAAERMGGAAGAAASGAAGAAGAAASGAAGAAGAAAEAAKDAAETAKQAASGNGAEDPTGEKRSSGGEGQG